MTAFAIDFRRDRITVASDTLAYVPDRKQGRPLGFMSKIFPVPHLNAALFCRGMMQIAALAATRLNLSPQLHTLEDAAAALPEILAAETERWAEEQEVSDPQYLLVCEAAFCGWSEAERRCRMWYYLIDALGEKARSPPRCVLPD